MIGFPTEAGMNMQVHLKKRRDGAGIGLWLKRAVVGFGKQSAGIPLL